MTRNRAQKHKTRTAAKNAGTTYTAQLRKEEASAQNAQGKFPDLSHIPAAPGTDRVLDDDAARELADTYVTSTQVPIGVNQVSGEPVLWDLTQIPHIRVEGSTGSGKTTLLQQIAHIAESKDDDNDAPTVWIPGMRRSMDTEMIVAISREIDGGECVLAENEHLVIVLVREYSHGSSLLTGVPDPVEFEKWLSGSSRVHLLAEDKARLGVYLWGRDLIFEADTSTPPACVHVGSNGFGRDWGHWIPRDVGTDKSRIIGNGMFVSGDVEVPLSAWRATKGVQMPVSIGPNMTVDHRKFPHEFPLHEVARSEGIYLGVAEGPTPMVARNRNKFVAYIPSTASREAITHAFAANALARGEKVLVVADETSDDGRDQRVSTAEVMALTRAGAFRLPQDRVDDLVRIAGQADENAPVSLIYFTTNRVVDAPVAQFIGENAGERLNVLTVFGGEINHTPWELLDNAAVLFGDNARQRYQLVEEWFGDLTRVIIDNSEGMVEDGEAQFELFSTRLSDGSSGMYAMPRVWTAFPAGYEFVLGEFAPYRCGQSIARSASKRRYESKSLMDAWAARVHDFIESSTEQ